MSSACIRAIGRFTAATLLLAGCATTGRTNDPGREFAALLDSLGHGTGALEGPAVNLTTDDDYGRYSRVSTRLYVAEDAYVAVVNVSPAGYARIVFPEAPADDAFLPGGKVYTVPSLFTGYRHATVEPAGAAGTRYVWYGRSSSARLGARGPGYLFVVASRARLDLAALERAGYFDEVSVGSALSEMEPASVIPRVALVATGATGRGVSVDYARYSGYDPLTYASSMFAGAYNTGYCDTGYAAFGPMSVAAWDLSYGQGGCSASDLLRWRRRNELLTRWLPRPWSPPVPRDTTSPDSSRTAPPRVKPERVKPEVDTTVHGPTTPFVTPPAQSAREQFLRIREQLRATTSGEELLHSGEPRRGRPVQEVRESPRAERQPEARPERRSEPLPERRPEPAPAPRPERPAEQPVERPVERSVERPVERPVARPVERPTPEPARR